MADRSLSERDRAWVWHPYSRQGSGDPPLAVMRAEGAYLHLEDGRRLLDGISSWWVNIHGHAHPVIAEAIAAQARRLEHVIFAGFTHEPAVTLAGVLLQETQRAGARTAKVFYSDNGSTAVEVALKLAYQYHLNRGVRGRGRFLALEGAYHGDTFGAMAVSEPGGYHAQFRELLAPVDFVSPSDLEAFKNLLHRSGSTYAAMIIEPRVQGAGGMRMIEPGFLREAARLCAENGILLICDEVFTGFGRTGTPFAFSQAELKPDLICVSKGLTGGFLPLAATLCTAEVHAAFHGEDPRLTFLHGHSYTANPITCAAAVAACEITFSADCHARIQAISRQTEARIAELARLPGVRGARSLGTIGAIDLPGEAAYGSDFSAHLRRTAIAQGVLLRPLGNVLYAVPPYCCTSQEIDRIYDTFAVLWESLKY